jgi:hypothetical protein
MKLIQDKSDRAFVTLEKLLLIAVACAALMGVVALGVALMSGTDRGAAVLEAATGEMGTAGF